MKKFAAALLLLVLVLPVCAQEDGVGFDELFEGEILEEEEQPTGEEGGGEDLFEAYLFEAVSYTHLTLPTN